jgi:hypothetical protein
MDIRRCVKYLLLLSDSNETRVMEVKLARTELFHADGRTDRHYEAASRFS